MEKSVHITIESVSALLMHAYPLVPIQAFEKLSKEEQAEHAAYRTKEKELYIPGISLQRAFISGASYSKGKGRSSLVKQAAACINVDPEYVLLGVKSYDIDTRPIVNPTTKGRVLRHRPRFDKWKVSFTVKYDPTLLTEQQLRTIIDDTGSRVGVLDFRPEKKGPFGRFSVTSWKS